MATTIPTDSSKRIRPRDNEDEKKIETLPTAHNDNENENENDDDEKPAKEEGEEEEQQHRSYEGHTGATPLHSDATSERRRPKGTAPPTLYGVATQVSASGSFPNVGSILGPYFCLGKLGMGTFSSIHKCIHLSSSTTTSAAAASHKNNKNKNNTVVAAKVELGEFQQSGVLESEATILDFLHRTLPPGTVPHYFGHYKSGTRTAALVMEYLPCQDMHQLREQVMAGSSTRRLATDDAVYLCAHVLVPLLERMHAVGMVHRDVKPSNCVRATEKEFKLVDFGLSKSFVVPLHSEYADSAHVWTQPQTQTPTGEQQSQQSQSTNNNKAAYLKPRQCSDPGAYRKERKKADFRGTSMYASLRVHQGKDYCPRDDIWSLLYVFCDLLSGGLPWMSHAANRDRAGCQAFKERVQGENTSIRSTTNTKEDDDDDDNDKPDEMSLLLMGDVYHIAAFKREQRLQIPGVDVARVPTLPQPLSMSRDPEKVKLLRDAFDHVASLQFTDMPDYEFIKRCMQGFLKKAVWWKDPDIRPIQWKLNPPASPILKRPNAGYPEWKFVDDQEEQDNDSLEEDIFEDAQIEWENQKSDTTMGRLPLEFQFRLAQMEHNSSNTCTSASNSASASNSTTPQEALSGWMRVVLPLLYKEWDARKYEDGGHRTATDGFRRERYLGLLQDCFQCAKKQDFFRAKDLYYQGTKKRKVLLESVPESAKRAPMVFVSRALYGLERAIAAEKAKKPPPPMRISFS
jgi:serine/threonine protein kinase